VVNPAVAMYRAVQSNPRPAKARPEGVAHVAPCSGDRVSGGTMKAGNEMYAQGRMGGK